MPAFACPDQQVAKHGFQGFLVWLLVFMVESMVISDTCPLWLNLLNTTLSSVV